MERQGFFLHQVEYNPARHVEAIRDLCQLIVPAWRAVLELIAPQPLAADQHLHLATSLVCNRLGWALEALAPFQKHPSFRDEDEWRYFASAEFLEGLQQSETTHSFEVKDLVPRFRVSTWAAVPYVEVSVKPPTAAPSLNEVVAGPNPDSTTLRGGLGRLLKTSGWTCNSLVPSTSPYRSW